MTLGSLGQSSPPEQSERTKTRYISLSLQSWWIRVQTLIFKTKPEKGWTGDVSQLGNVSTRYDRVLQLSDRSCFTWKCVSYIDIKKNITSWLIHLNSGPKAWINIWNSNMFSLSSKLACRRFWDVLRCFFLFPARLKSQHWRVCHLHKIYVVWALGECIYFFHSFLLILMCVLLHIQLIINMLHDIETGGRLWRWEMAQMIPDTSFGPWWVFFYFIFPFVFWCQYIFYSIFSF